MDNQPIRKRRILEALEACRPGSDDVADPALEYLAAELDANPELEVLYGRLQRVDETLAAAFRDVPVPEGLQQRLLDRLAASRAAEAATADSTKAAEILAEDRQVAVPVRPRRISRRWAAAGVALTAAAIALVVTVFLPPEGIEPYNKQMVLEDALEFFVTDEAPRPGAQLDDHDNPPRPTIHSADACGTYPTTCDGGLSADS